MDNHEVFIKGGYVLLSRNLLTSDTWLNLPQSAKIVFINLLLLANHKPHKWYNPLLKQEIQIERGQLITGRKALAKQCRVSEWQIRTALSRLQVAQNIAIKPTNHFSLITICNYNIYQNPSNYESPAVPPANHQQTTTNNNDKNEIYIKGGINPPPIQTINNINITMPQPTRKRQTTYPEKMGWVKPSDSEVANGLGLFRGLKK